MSTTTHDEAAFLAAICAAPEDDLPRLVYADWLDDQGRTARCGKCFGFPNRQFYAGSTGLGTPTYTSRCPDCDGTGRVPDGNAARAELVRVQVELAKPDPKETCDCGKPWERRNLSSYPVPMGLCRRCGLGPFWPDVQAATDRRDALRRRERELFDQHRKLWFADVLKVTGLTLSSDPAEPSLAPACLRCDGSGSVSRSPYSLPEPCPQCHGIPGYQSVLPAATPLGIVRRGFVDALRVPLAAVVAACGNGCLLVNGRHIVRTRHHPFTQVCPKCKGTGHVPGPAAAVVRSQPVTRVEIVGAEPVDRSPYSDTPRYRWYYPDGGPQQASDLPSPLLATTPQDKKAGWLAWAYDPVRGWWNEWSSVAAARNAASTAALAYLRTTPP